MPETRSGRLYLTIPCSLEQVRPAAARLRGFLTDAGVPEAAVADCELALVEACNNLVIHGSSLPATLDLQFQIEEHSITLTITDRSAGFNWPEEVQLPDPLAEQGRGLYLLKAVSDEVEYFRGKDRNTLRIKKRL